MRCKLYRCHPLTELLSRPLLLLSSFLMGVVHTRLEVLFHPHGLRGLPPLLLGHLRLLRVAHTMAVERHAHQSRGLGRARQCRRGLPDPL